MTRGSRAVHSVLLLSVLPVIAGLAVEARPVTGDVVVEEAWVRAVPSSQTTTGVFLTLVNRGSADRTLVDARTPRAKTVELHEMAHEGDRMRMRRVERIVVPAGGKVVLRPGGLHLMVFGLSVPLAKGDRLPLTLVFDDGATIDVDAEARMPGEVR